MIDSLLGKPLEEEKILKLTRSTRLSFEWQEIQSLLAAISFILQNAAKFSVDPAILTMELEQLGLPKDISLSMVKSFQGNSEGLRKKQLDSIVKLTAPEKINWRVDYILSAGSTGGPVVNEPEVLLDFQFPLNNPRSSHGVENFPLTLSKENFLLFYQEMKQAKKIMENIN